MLHVTNGDVVSDALHESELPGTALSWLDVLHDGPAPEGLSPAELSEVRVRFLADAGWADADAAASAFARRDAALAGSAEEGEIVLWFEWDLDDQLQLLQILDRLAGQDRAAEVSLVDYAGYLGHLAPSELVALFPRRTPVTAEQLQLARRAWAAFRSPDPTSIEELVRGDTGALPHLAPALRRHLEEFPDVGAGLSHTERQILEAAAGAPRTREDSSRLTRTGRSDCSWATGRFWLTSIDSPRVRASARGGGRPAPGHKGGRRRPCRARGQRPAERRRPLARRSAPGGRAGLALGPCASLPPGDDRLGLQAAKRRAAERVQSMDDEDHPTSSKGRSAG
jgi:hypothetical protein